MMGAPARCAWSEQGDGPVVVLLHSSPSTKSQWRALVQRLAPTHRTLAIDLLGYGDAPGPGVFDGFGLADEVRHIDAVLAQRLAPHEPFHLIGHSYGGAVALRLAQVHAPRVRSLALYEPTAFQLVAPGDLVIDATRRLAANFTDCTGDPVEAELQTRRFVDFWNGAGAFDAQPEPRRAALVRAMPKVRYDFRAIFGDAGHPEVLAALRVPTCLIAGRTTPACAHRVIAALAGAVRAREMHWVAAGHMAPVTHPERVNPLFEAFVRRADERVAPIESTDVCLAA
jgi:pimeloyl-ACP methyl ester carboxylesterase